MRSATRTRRGGAVAFQGRDGVDVVDDAHVSVAHQPAARLAPILPSPTMPICIEVRVVIRCCPHGFICVAAVPGPLVGWAARGSASVGWAR